jgi:hypothetical protein
MKRPHHVTFPVVVYCRISAQGPFGQARPALESDPTSPISKALERMVAQNKRALMTVNLMRDMVSGEPLRRSLAVLYHFSVGSTLTAYP